jgi:hypothetical protein
VMAYCHWPSMHRALDAADSIASAARPGDRKWQAKARVELLVLIAIARHFNPVTNSTFLSHATVARETLMSTREVQRVIDRLVDSGHLLREGGVKGQLKPNVYRFGPAVPPMVISDSAPPQQQPAPAASSVPNMFSSTI